jgi:non-heme chloroperoxidase
MKKKNVFSEALSTCFTPVATNSIMLIALLTIPALAKAQVVTGWHDPSSHKIRFVTVQKDVKLEVLDWGGTGQPVVLLTGLGNSAHAFDDFAPKLTGNFHVYGVTRRGFGASSVPLTGYNADRLGDDIIAILDSLKIIKPVVIGHSIAGEELSSIGTRFPERISKLIYLEAAKPYAYYDKEHGDYQMDAKTVAVYLDSAKNNLYDVEAMKTLAANLSILQQSLHNTQLGIQADMDAHTGPSGGPTTADLATFSAMQKFVAKQIGGNLPEAELRQTFNSTKEGSVGSQKTPSYVYDSIIYGERKYGAVKVPVLVIEAVPKLQGNEANTNPAKLATASAIHDAQTRTQLKAFQAGNPSARIIEIPNAYHYIYLSNEAEVIKNIVEFIKERP